MVNSTEVQSTVSRYISASLRDHFGKGPTSAFVTLSSGFITIHLRGFLSPSEKILLKQERHNLILEMRDLLLEELKPDIRFQLLKSADFEASYIFADSDLEKQTCLILAEAKQLPAGETAFHSNWPDSVDKDAFRQVINEMSEKAQKRPEQTELYWLSDRTILVKRVGILVEIEKALIANGYSEELKISKRPLESELLDKPRLERILDRKIDETFLDWDFEEDVGYIVFTLMKE